MKLSSVKPDLTKIRRELQEDFVSTTGHTKTRSLHNLKGWYFDNFPHQFITISSLGVFGLDQALTDTSPLKIAHVTGRFADVVADPTVQLAAEAYRRRKGLDTDSISIATFHQCTRLQRYLDPTYKPVFEMLGTLDSGRSNTGNSFEIDAITMLIGKYSSFISSVFPDSSLEIILGHVGIARLILDIEGQRADKYQRAKVISNRLPQTLRGVIAKESIDASSIDEILPGREFKFFYDQLGRLARAVEARDGIPNLHFHLDRIDGVGHYSGLVFSINVDGINLVDGGCVDWVRKLTANERERTIVSGFGASLFVDMFENVNSVSEQ